ACGPVCTVGPGESASTQANRSRKVREVRQGIPGTYAIDCDLRPGELNVARISLHRKRASIQVSADAKASFPAVEGCQAGHPIPAARRIPCDIGFCRSR